MAVSVMASGEDAASVLESFIHDVANLPAEIEHLYQEMQTKDQEILKHQNIIEALDHELQSFVKLNGSLVRNPNEKPHSKVIEESYGKCQSLMDENVLLTSKAADLLDRHVKRLDIKIRDLTVSGAIPHDPQLPSLLRDSPGNLVAPTSSVATGSNTPLNPLSVNVSAGSQLVANAAIARLTSAVGQSRNPSSPAMIAAGSMLSQANPSNTSGIHATSATNRQREMSISSDAKRHRLNTSFGSLPSANSSFARQSPIGSGTPKAGTPTTSRAGSLGPRPRGAVKTSIPAKANRKTKMSRAAIANKSSRRLMSELRASSSTTGDDESMVSDADVSDENASALGHDGAADNDPMDMEDDADDTQYCVCERVSFGDMVACDNPKCEIQWFHWECVGLTQEPKGEWLCPICDPNSKYEKKKKKAR